MAKNQRKRNRTAEKGRTNKRINLKVEYSELEATLSDGTRANMADLSKPVEHSSTNVNRQTNKGTPDNTG